MRMQVYPKVHAYAALSPEAKATLRRTLGEEAEELIAAHEKAEQPSLGFREIDQVELGDTPVEVPKHLETLLTEEKGPHLALKGLSLLRAIPEENEQARFQVAEKLLESMQNDEKVGGFARLGLAGLGRLEVPHEVAPYDSLLERSLNDFQPGRHLLPTALKALEAAAHREPSPSNMVKTGREMADAMPYGDKPMAKLYAGLRLAMASAKEIGDVRAAQGSSGAAQPLRNLKRNASSVNIARIFYTGVEKSFNELERPARLLEDEQRMRETYLRGDGPITDGIDFENAPDVVTIGDVDLEINW